MPSFPINPALGQDLAVGPREPSPADIVRIYDSNVDRACERWEGRGEAVNPLGRVWNNCGPDIDEQLLISGVGRRNADGSSKGGPWCGVGASTMCVLGTGTRDPRFAPFKMHAGAKQVARNLAKVGGYIVKPQTWTRWGTWKGDLDVEAMELALLIVWHRGDETMRGNGHVGVRPRYNPVTRTMSFWNPNASPQTAQRNEMNERLGLSLIKGQAVWHYRVLPEANWRKRLWGIATLDSTGRP